MKSIFLDCNDQLAPVWARVIRPDDPKIDVNREAFAREELPRVIAGYDIAHRRPFLHADAAGGAVPGAQAHRVPRHRPGELHECRRARTRGVTVHIIKGYGDTAVAEHTIALMVAAARDIARMDREVRGGIWTPHEGVQLLGKTLGVIGLGGIGCEVARIGKGIGMEVIGWNRTRRAGVPLADTRHAAGAYRTWCR